MKLTILSSHVLDSIRRHAHDEHLVECSHEAHEHLHRAHRGKHPLSTSDGTQQGVVADSGDQASRGDGQTGAADTAEAEDDRATGATPTGTDSTGTDSTGTDPTGDDSTGDDSSLRRTVYHGKHRDSLPGEPRRAEGEAGGDNRRVDEAYDGAGRVHAFFRDAYGRRGIDDSGMELVQTVHHRKSYMNAYWNGESMVYGDGDGTVFVGFTHSLTVIAHEITHGVVQHCGGLTYAFQSGALNESLADVFGVLCEQCALGHEADEASWLVGHDIFGDGVDARGLRDLAAPGTAYDDATLGSDPQIAHMDRYVETSRDDDNGGVHTNSGIPNHAFYRLAVALGGRAWETPGRIWYEALRALDDQDPSFETWARATAEQAARLHGSGSREAQAVDAAWRAVGVVV